MNPVEVVLVVVGLAAVLAVAIIPFALPWPQHLRWLVASMSVPDPVSMSVGTYPLTMREVTVGGVHRRADIVIVEVIDVSYAGRSSFYLLDAADAAPTAVACLERWSAARTPLLLAADHAGEGSLHGPAHAVVGLRPAATGDARDGLSLLAVR